MGCLINLIGLYLICQNAGCNTGNETFLFWIGIIMLFADD